MPSSFLLRRVGRTETQGVGRRHRALCHVYWLSVVSACRALRLAEPIAELASAPPFGARMCMEGLTACRAELRRTHAEPATAVRAELVEPRPSTAAQPPGARFSYRGCSRGSLPKPDCCTHMHTRVTCDGIKQQSHHYMAEVQLQYN